MSIFIDPDQTFEITVRFILKGSINDTSSAIKILRGEEEDENQIELTCDVSGRDFDTMSKILEEATIINSVTGAPMVRTSIFCKLVILNFFRAWNLNDSETGKQVPITQETVGKMRYELVRELTSKWLDLTSAK
jgi:hypothetical protein